MKILLVEDKPANIESAKIQFVGHELVIATTVMEALPKIGNEYDLVLTDLNVVTGTSKDIYFDDPSQTQPNKEIPIGFVVAIGAIQLNVPCIVLSDENAHHSMMGLVLERTIGTNCDKTIARVSSEERKRREENGEWDDTKYPSYTPFFGLRTRPEWIETPLGKGKDWVSAVKNSPWKHLLDSGISTQ